LQKPTPTAAASWRGAAVDATQVDGSAVRRHDGAEPRRGVPVDRATADLPRCTPARRRRRAIRRRDSHHRIARDRRAPLAGVDAPAAGRVFVFDRATGALVFPAREPVAKRRRSVGAAVTAIGDDIAVGAPLDDGDVIDTGTVYLFDGTSGVLLETLPNPAQAPFDHFSGAGGRNAGAADRRAGASAGLRRQRFPSRGRTQRHHHPGDGRGALRQRDRRVGRPATTAARSTPTTAVMIAADRSAAPSTRSATRYDDGDQCTDDARWLDAAIETTERVAPETALRGR
jgi:hypothetical protein